MIQQDVKQRFEASLGRLNDMQRQAVMTTDGALLLLAGAGSGKTTVLMNRIANLLVNEGADPYEIIAITFTNKAAGEMKARLERMNIPGSADVWASTFHSACARILRRDIDKLGYDRSFTIYDTSDTLAMLKRIMKDQGLDDKSFPPKSVLGSISRAKDEMLSPEQVIRNAEKESDMRRRHIGACYAEYEKRMKNSNSLDFDDLILLTVKLFDECPDVLQRYQNRFKYIHVDEYQDTNKLQYILTSSLAGVHGNICVVGDDDQSIYKFRGATIENILSFENHYKNARIIRLEQNYRSTGAILNAANEVIKNNANRKGKNLWTQSGAGEKPVLRVVADEREEAQFVAGEISRSVEGGKAWNDHVVLYRTNAQSYQFEMAFRRFDIPYKVYGGTGFYERAEVKDMLAYLCVVQNPDDDIRLLRIINNPPRGIGDTTVERLRLVAEELGLSLYRAIAKAHEYENMASAMPKLRRFAQMIETLREHDAPEQLDTLYDELLKQTGYLRMLREKKSEENTTRIENVEELKTSIIAFMKDNGGTLFDFLSEAALYTDLDRDDQSSDKVLLMTMHSAKGLEFDTVFIAGAEEGLFPGQRAIGYPDEMEEERRLCYVAMTRAMRKLFFMSARQRMIYGRTSSAQPSRFVSEIPPDGIEVDHGGRPSYVDAMFDPSKAPPPQSSSEKRPSYVDAMFSRPGKPAPAAKSPPRPSAAPKPGRAFAVGESIAHKAFGNGTIKEITPAGSDALLVIEFESGETKRLLKNSASKFIT